MAATIRQRKLDARENRQESLKKSTAEKTKQISVPKVKKTVKEKAEVKEERKRSSMTKKLGGNKKVITGKGKK